MHLAQFGSRKNNAAPVDAQVTHEPQRTTRQRAPATEALIPPRQERPWPTQLCRPAAHPLASPFLPRAAVASLYVPSSFLSPWLSGVPDSPGDDDAFESCLIAGP